VVCGAGTGGTSATIGRFIRYCRYDSELCVADPVHSVFHRHFADATVTALPEGCGSRIEGIGRPRVEPSFVPSVIDRMIAVEDADSIGAMRALSDRLGRRVGGSTGTNLIACMTLIDDMAAAGRTGSVVTLLCDGGERYGCTYYDDAWLSAHGVHWEAAAARTAAFLGS
jgi:cysteine synthase